MGKTMIYMNNAATTFPKPQEVVNAVNSYLIAPPSHSERSGIEKESEDFIFNTREKLAELFNVPKAEQIVFTSGSTEALNIALKGLPLEGGHVVSTKIEHNSVIRPLMMMKEEGKIGLDFVDCDDKAYVPPENIERAIRPDTRAVVVNHCSNVTGQVLDIKAIAEIAHKNDCYFIVDASQSAGALPIDVVDMDIDFMAFTGHKSLYGMPGIGGLYIREGMKPRPLKVGGTGILSEVLTQPEGMPIFYEAGTPNLPGIVSLRAGVQWVLERGIDAICDHKKRQLGRIMEELEPIEEITVYNNMDDHSSCTVFCFNIKNLVPEEVNYVLESSYDISVRSGLHCAPLLLEALGVHPWGTVRASPSFFTKDEEIEKFIDAIKDIVKTMVRR
ncbi:MAG: aminotransferase class V-fold PLP-dependent enzyme [Candidatus Kapaibacterium sp.]